MEQLKQENFITIDGSKCEISADQNEIKYGYLKLIFFEAKKIECCRRCFLLRSTCCEVPCSPYKRIDKKNGYYSIHEMPTEKERSEK